MFADDTNIFLKHKDVNQAKLIMNNDLVKVQDWFTANKLVLNVSKTHYMTFGNNTDGSEVGLFINDMKIVQVKTVKFLGVFIDEEMKWKSHILSKVSKNIGIMNKLKEYIPEHILILLYNTLVLPHLNDCIILWGRCNKYLLERLHKLQKLAVRIITKLLFIKLKIFSFNFMNITLACLCFYIINNCYLICSIHYSLKTWISIIMIQEPNLTFVSIMDKLIFHMLRTKTIWNELPQSVREGVSLNSFKRKLKYFLLNNIE